MTGSRIHLLSLANIFLFKVKNRKTAKMCEMCSKSTLKTQERHFGVPFVKFKHI